MERKYAMTRIAAGDYLLPSNDEQILWRISSYLEDGSAGNYFDGRWRPITGTFWAAHRFTGTMREAEKLLHTDSEVLLDWGEWREVAMGMRTRKEAVDYALNSYEVAAMRDS